MFSLAYFSIVRNGSFISTACKNGRVVSVFLTECTDGRNHSGYFHSENMLVAIP